MSWRDGFLVNEEHCIDDYINLIPKSNGIALIQETLLGKGIEFFDPIYCWVIINSIPSVSDIVEVGNRLSSEICEFEVELKGAGPRSGKIYAGRSPVKDPFEGLEVMQ